MMSMTALAQKADAPKAAPGAKAPPAAARKGPLPALPEKVASVEGINEYRLANGLRVLLFPDASKPTITVNITYLVGSRHENYGETGMAHLLEHLVFKGTPKNPDIDKQFNKRGMRTNGTTWFDRTNYYELFQASEENLEWAIQMEADRMVNSFIAKKDLDSEMTVVRNEYEMGENQPGNVLIKRMASVAYDWHNYANSTIGNRSDIENVKIENLQAFYRMYYQPDNAVLLVAGKFDEAKTLGLIQKYFGPIPKPARTLPKLWTVEPTQDGERQFFVRRKGDIQLVVLGYKMPSGLHPDADTMAFTNFVLGDVPTGRLHKALVETGKAAQIFTFPLAGVDGSLHMIGAAVKKGDPFEPVLAEMTRIVEDFHKHPPTAEELDRAKKNFANEAERTLNNHENIGIELSEYIALGDWRLFFKDRDDAQAVTAEQVKAATAKYYRRDNRVVGIFQPEDAPQRAELPAPPALADVLKDFKPKVAVQQAEAFDPSNANIDKRTRVVNIGGIQLALLSKKNRGETVNVSLRFNSGDEKSLFGKGRIGAMTGAMLTRGSTKFTRTQIADESDKLKMQGGVSGLSANYQTTRPNLAATLKFAAHVMREPAFPESEFEQLRKQLLTQIEAQKSDPQAVASITLGQHFNQFPRGDLRYSPTLAEAEEDVKAVTLQQVKDYHKQFYAAAKGQIAVVGDFDEAEVEKAVREAFGDWKGGVPYQRISTPYKDIAPANKSLETPDKENAIFIARMNLDAQDTDADYAALWIANYIMGGGAGLDSRLAARIREKDGLSYGAGSQLGVGSTDRGGNWTAFAIGAPQNVAMIEVAFNEEVARALKDGFTAEELAKAKSGALQQRLQQRAQDGPLSNGLRNNLYLNRTFAWSAALEAKIQALKPEDVTAAFRKHIDPKKITIVKAGDFVKAAKLAAEGKK
ncbi:MAG: insulinase family protein [Betaproteobacteria bacterium]|nr:insulinase family protein [Betaproteobacteria bacterium]